MARRNKRRGGRFRDIRQARRRAKKLLKKGTKLGSKILPEVFEGGSGLDRTEFEKVNFGDINQYLAPSVAEAEGLRSDIRGGYDELLGLRRAKLGGLDSAENAALKESLFRNINRQRSGALRDVARTSGLGAGASFAQRRALGRDYGDAALRADKDLLLTNVDVKRRALNDFEGTTGARANALGSAQDRISALRGLQATGRQATDQFNSQGKFASDQFNAGQQQAELGARVGAISAGTGLIGDERDAIEADRIRKELMDFLAQRDQSLFEQAQSLFG